MALYFAGSTGNYAEITLGYGNTLSNTAGMISFWLKPIYDFGIPISTKGSSSSRLFVETFNTGGTLYFGINSFTAYTNVSFLSDTWVHIAMGGNSTAQIPYGMIYVNGSLAAQHTLTTAVWSTAASNLYLGRWDNNTYPYLGWIGDIRAWNRRLTSAEVLSVYNNQDVTSGLVERWPLTESSGSTITGTVGGNNGTITGTPVWGGTAIPYGTPASGGIPIARGMHGGMR